MAKLITVTTDFQDQFSSSQLRAVIASLGFRGQVIENHSVTPFSISEGSFMIRQIAKFSPPSSVHLGVVDPGVGSSRWGIVIKAKRSWFIGPNNGLLYQAAKSEGIKKVFRLQESSFGDEIANTFHGRDVFIKAAVYLASGKNPENFGCLLIKESDLLHNSFGVGEVIHIDAYGNYKIHWPYKLAEGKKLHVKNGNNKVYKFPVVKTFADVPPNKPLAYNGSHNTLELAINLSNAAKHFKFTLGQRLTIRQV